MFSNFLKRLKGKKGATATIEMLFLSVLMFSIVVTILDMGMYFNNRYVVINAAQNGARLAAVFGGTDDTPVSKKYGINFVTADCNSFGATTPIECSVLEELKNSKGTVNVEVKSIDCGPGLTRAIGERTYCEIIYSYNGMPASGLSMTNMFKNNTVRMTAESEVVNK